LICFYRSVEPCFDASDGGEIGIILLELFLLDNLGGQQIGVYDPSRTTPTFNIRTIVERALATAIWTTDYP
jgi:hypothetical protein